MSDYTLSALQDAAAIVHRAMPPTPQFRWPLLAARTGADVWVKHENHTPLGAFKVRGGLVHTARIARERPGLAGVIAATRGNHGQSVAFAAAKHGLRSVVVVPHGNSREKNAAMKALGAELIEHGHDFEAALERMTEIARERGFYPFPSFHRDLVLGVGSYALELFTAAPDLDAVYAPIGMGSGICGLIAARDALGLKAEIVGAVAENAAAYALSFQAGRAIATNSSDTMADGLAVRVPHPEALAMILRGAARMVTVSEAEIGAAMRHFFTDTHNLAEGAGAAALAALTKERARMAGKKTAIILSGGNIDRDVYARIVVAVAL